MTTEIIKDTHFKKTASGLKPDAKGRITLSKVKMPEDVTYHVYTNDLGQIVLDPQITIPASEAWLYLNENAMGAVRRGLYEAAQGNVSKADLDAQ
jgi:hypothetical protein